LNALQELSIEPEINLDGSKLKQRNILGVKKLILEVSTDEACT
jgi:hypothetical protein